MDIEPTILGKREEAYLKLETIDQQDCANQIESTSTAKRLKEDLQCMIKIVDSNLLKESQSVNDMGINTMALFNPEIIIEKIKRQLEFYMGDPNLKKDRHLQSFLKNNKKGYIDLSVFLNFKRIREIYMEASISDSKEKLKLMQSAGDKSELLKLNQLRNKLRRIIKFTFQLLSDNKDKEDTDLRTIYVENLPPQITQEDIADIFKKCGTIVHVSLPKMHNKQSKGFCFVEFAVSFFLYKKIGSEKCIIGFRKG